MRLCRIGDSWRAHPRAKDLIGTDAEIVYSGTATKCVMIEASAGSGKVTSRCLLFDTMARSVTKRRWIELNTGNLQ